MDHTRRRLLATVGTATVGTLGGCLGGQASEGDTEPIQSSFFVFDAVTERVAGDAAETGLLVPIGQHGHGWEPGPSVREEIRDAELLVHGMEGFQPWVDDVIRDLGADNADVTTVDVSAELSLLGTNDEHGDGDTHEHDSEGDHAHGTVDPHFWMDPLRVRDAVDPVQRELTAIDPDGEDAYAANAETFRSELAELHERIDSTVAAASNDVILVAGHDSFGYLADRYDVTVEALTNVSPDDRMTTRDRERAQRLIETHDLRYVCADPLGSQRAAEQLVAETDAEEVLPLTAMPGLTEAWAENDWGYVDVMETVNLQTIDRVLNA